MTRKKNYKGNLAPTDILYGDDISFLFDVNDAEGQKHWLEENGIPYIIGANKRPKVLREALLMANKKTMKNNAKSKEKLPANIPRIG